MFEVKGLKGAVKDNAPSMVRKGLSKTTHLQYLHREVTALTFGWPFVTDGLGKTKTQGAFAQTNTTDATTTHRMPCHTSPTTLRIQVADFIRLI